MTALYTNKTFLGFPWPHYTQTNQAQALVQWISFIPLVQWISFILQPGYNRLVKSWSKTTYGGGTLRKRVVPNFPDLKPRARLPHRALWHFFGNLSNHWKYRQSNKNDWKNKALRSTFLPTQHVTWNSLIPVYGWKVCVKWKDTKELKQKKKKGSECKGPG